MGWQSRESSRACLATVVLLGEMVLVAFPEAASRLLTRAMVSAANQVERFDARGPL